MHCFENKSEIFPFKNAVEMFSAYMQEANFKNFLIFNLFYLLLCFEPQVCIGKSSFRIGGVVLWRGSVRNIILLHTLHSSATFH